MIYLDHNATTPTDDRVVEAMLPYLGRFYGNPSSLHKLGRLSRGAIDQARESVAALIGAKASQIVFTSGGTEANNLAIRGYADAHPEAAIAYGATEHPSVVTPVTTLGSRGHRVLALGVDGEGRLRPSALSQALEQKPALISVMLANNETGVIQDFSAVMSVAARCGAVVHTDAVQAAGKMPVDFAGLGVQMMSLSGHKIGGPKGIGALVLVHTVALAPLLAGGGQEQGLRAGTENVAAIVGFGKAAELATTELAARSAHCLALRQQLEAFLRTRPGVTLFAQTPDRLPNTLQFAIDGLDGEMLVMLLDQAGFAVSSGSACAAGGSEPSPVLTAMGVPSDLAKSAVRVSLGFRNTQEELTRLMTALERCCSALV